MPSPGSIMMADDLREEQERSGAVAGSPPSSGEPRPPRGGGTSSVREYDTPLAVVPWNCSDAATDRNGARAYGPFNSRADAEYVQSRLLGQDIRSANVSKSDWIIVPLLRSP